MGNDKVDTRVTKEFRLFNIVLWQKLEGSNSKEYRILGLPISMVENNEHGNVQKFLGGLIYTIKSSSPMSVCEHNYHKTFPAVITQKTTKFLGIPIVQRITENDINKYYLGGFFIHQFHLAAPIFNKYLKKVKNDYDDIYILNANSGETFLFFAYLSKAFLEKNKSQKPLFVATKKYHIDIIKLYYPDAQYIYINNIKIKTRSCASVFKGHNIYTIFNNEHYQKIEIDIKNNEINSIHYLKSMLETLGLTENDYYNLKPIIPTAVENSVQNKINEINLDLNNFIIIAPEALTCDDLSPDFWLKLTASIRQLGYEIFINITDIKNNIEGCKSIPLSYQEIFCLAQKAKAIVSLRSGLTEFLLPTMTPNIAIYTKFRKRKAEKSFNVDKTIAGFSMLKFPFISKNSIVEINADKYLNEDDLMKDVLNSLKKFLNIEENLK